MSRFEGKGFFDPIEADNNNCKCYSCDREIEKELQFIRYKRDEKAAIILGGIIVAVLIGVLFYL